MVLPPSTSFLYRDCQESGYLRPFEISRPRRAYIPQLCRGSRDTWARSQSDIWSTCVHENRKTSPSFEEPFCPTLDGDQALQEHSHTIFVMCVRFLVDNVLRPDFCLQINCGSPHPRGKTYAGPWAGCRCCCALYRSCCGVAEGPHLCSPNPTPVGQ